MRPREISINLAKKLILRAQLLEDTVSLPPGKEGVLSTINKLGYVQIDTIAVIKRAHHHVIWTRCSDYNEEMLHELQAIDRQVFEYWGHAMSYLPMSDYRYALPRMKNFENPTSPWAKYQFQKCQNLLEPVLKRIQEEGPLSSSDFKPLPGKKAGGWWDWKPDKVALELLFWQGRLMITERKNFQKIYDLTERVLPAEINTTMPAREESGMFMVKKAISALGVAEEREIIKFMQPASSRDGDIQLVDKKQISSSLRKLAEEGEVTAFKIEGNNNSMYYGQANYHFNESASRVDLSQVYILSPFDNLIIQRDRLKRLFNFEYTLECYLPANKRKYGYFNLPILWGNDFVGRLDPRADRKNKTMIIKNLVFESGYQLSDEFLKKFSEKLNSFVQFNNCIKIKFENCNPGKYKSVLNSILNRQYDLD